jgi:AcrR family transcriptional regulator
MHTQEIKDAAVGLFRKLSFTKTAIKDIAQAAGIGKGTVYLYFASKDDILLSLVDDRLLALAEQYRPVYDDPGVSFEQKITTFIRVLVGEYFDLKDILFGSFDNLETRVLRDVFVKFDKYTDWFCRFLLQLVRDHRLDRTGDGRQIPETVMVARIEDFVTLLTGRIILDTIRHDWNGVDRLLGVIQPLGLRLFKQYVITE